jgi:hypothetical protein
MHTMRLAKLAACAAAALLIPATAGAQVPFTPAKGGYSIIFPEKPQEQQLSLAEGVTETVYSVNRSDAAFVAGYTEFSRDKLDVEKELVADIDGFVAQIKAKVTDRKRLAVHMTNGGRVQLVEFTFEGEKSAGRGVLVIPDDRSTIMVAALSLKPADSHAAVEEFVKSLKLVGQE